MEVWISKNEISDTCVTTDYELAHLVMQLHKGATMIHYNEGGKTAAYHISWIKEKKE